MTLPEDEIRLELFEAMLCNLPGAVVFADAANQIQTWTRSAETLFGTGPKDFANAPNVGKIVGLAVAAPEVEAADWSTATSAAGKLSTGDEDSMRRRFRTTITNSTGESIPVEVAVIDLIVVGEPWRMIVIDDGRAQDRTSAELERQAYTDPLSELLNRRGFQRDLESHLGLPLTLAIIDVDFFKRINDELGHSAGDEAIRWIARKLSESFSDAVCVGRLGGDEFGIVLCSTNVVQTQALFESFRDSVEADESACPLGMTISIGVAVASNAGTKPRELLSLADKAMYRSKRDGRNRVTIVEVETTR